MELDRFKEQPPQPPESVKIQAAQRVRSSQDEYFAVRYIVEQPSSTEIQSDGQIVPIPEFAAIAYNLKLFDGLAVFEWKLEQSVEEDRIKAHHRAEVWRAQNGKAKQLAEIWYASEIPGGQSFVEFISQFLKAEKKHEQAELAKFAPEPVKSIKRLSDSTEETPIDHRRNVRDVCEKLLRREYPQTFRALDQKARNEEVRKAFIADMVSNTGFAPEAEESEKLLQDSRFVDWLSSALDKRGHKVPRDEWALASGWVERGFYRMSKKELELALNERTGLKLKGDSWQRKARRLGLISSRKIGRPEKPNLLPHLC